MSLHPPNLRRSRSSERSEHDPDLARTGRRPSRLLAGVVLLALAVVAGLAVLRGSPGPVDEAATDVGTAPPPLEVDPAEPIDLDAVAASMDAAVTEAMEQREIPGGVLVVVADGAVAHARGFGHTDLDRGTPVDAGRTRFDIGSVSKLLTATAVMQQVEQGAVDLHGDVNDHLTGFRVPDTFDEPVTAAHLLTHTAGFAEVAVEHTAEDLPRSLPPRIRPAGVTHQYSNHGTGLAGHLLESVSGELFEEHVTANILEPLGMTRSSYGRPVADAHDVTPHEAIPGGTAAVPRVDPGMIATAGLWTTGEDIAAFMLAHLGGGEHDGVRILGPDTAAQMQATQFRPHPDVAGTAYGFFERTAGDRRGLQHGGSWVGASAFLYLLPDDDLGLFLAFNHGGGIEIAHTLIHDAVDRFLPATPRPNAAAAGSLGPTDDYAGQYRWNRHDRSSFMRLVSTLMVNRLTVTAGADGTVTTAMAPTALVPDATWVQTEPGVFVERDGTNTLVFEGDDRGRVVGLHVSGPQLFSMERLAWHETAGFALTVLLTLLGAALVVAVGWPVGAVRERLRRDHSDTPSSVHRARRLGGLAGGLLVAFFAGLVVHFAVDTAGLLGAGPALRALLWLPLASAALTVGLAVVVVRLWRDRGASFAGRVYYSSVTVALVAFVPFLLHLRLLGFNY